MVDFPVLQYNKPSNNNNNAVIINEECYLITKQKKIYTWVQSLSCLQIHEPNLSCTQVQGLLWLDNAITLLITRIIGIQDCLHVTHYFINLIEGLCISTSFWVLAIHGYLSGCVF